MGYSSGTLIIRDFRDGRVLAIGGVSDEIMLSITSNSSISRPGVAYTRFLTYPEEDKKISFTRSTSSVGVVGLLVTFLFSTLPDRLNCGHQRLIESLLGARRFEYSNRKRL
ncbi:hypothetical protein NPIL_336281 [Nephila pilipes]|uniref:Uncharacterized protein n=1 Tax=Nephila pilipes TaxID=299642 RepID=A0A8X6TPX5_NEPPI|nr:hypothetical protein NPIL_336281 [Nephila pilipes]